MYEQLKLKISNLVNFSDDEFALFISITQPQLKTYKRKDFILLEGQVCKHLYFIKKGCLTYYYNVYGELKIGQFFFENGLYTDLESFLTEQASEQTIQALEDTELLVISKKKSISTL